MGRELLSVEIDSGVLERFNQALTLLGINADDYFERCAEELISQGKMPFSQSDADPDFDLSDEDACDFVSAYVDKAIAYACCYELEDKTETVGHILPPEYAQASTLKQEFEEHCICDMLESRKDYGEFVGGDRLRARALEYFEKNKEQIMWFVNSR